MYELNDFLVNLATGLVVGGAVKLTSGDSDDAVKTMAAVTLGTAAYQWATPEFDWSTKVSELFTPDALNNQTGKPKVGSAEWIQAGIADKSLSSQDALNYSLLNSLGSKETNHWMQIGGQVLSSAAGGLLADKTADKNIEAQRELEKDRLTWKREDDAARDAEAAQYFSAARSNLRNSNTPEDDTPKPVAGTRVARDGTIINTTSNRLDKIEDYAQGVRR